MGFAEEWLQRQRVFRTIELTGTLNHCFVPVRTTVDFFSYYDSFCIVAQQKTALFSRTHDEEIDRSCSDKHKTQESQSEWVYLFSAEAYILLDVSPALIQREPTVIFARTLPDRLMWISTLPRRANRNGTCGTTRIDGRWICYVRAPGSSAAKKIGLWTWLWRGVSAL